MKVPFMDFLRMHNPIKEELENAILSVAAKGDFILGKKVEEFEQNFAKYCGAKYAAGTSTGTDALELILRALEIGEGDEVITAPNSFIATASAISSAGAKPIFADIDYETANINPNEIEKQITSKTKAIMPVHLYGQPVNMDEILKIANNKGLVVIEDSCQAHGAIYKQNRTGSLGIAAGFSFYPAKNLGCFGDGGIVVSNDKNLIDKVKMLRNYGQSEKYHHDFFAFNMRLDTMQAAVLDVKLPYLDAWNKSRRESAEKLNVGLKNIIKTPVVLNDRQSVHHLYVVNANSEKERNALQKHLQEKEVSTGLHYPIPIHLQKAYADLGLKKGEYPITERLCETGLTLPMFPGMKDEEIEYVIDSVKSFYK